MDPNFYSGLAHELLSKLDRLSTFTKHSPSIGYHHEEIVREFIRPILSSRFSIKTGFLFAGPDRVSHQCDLILVDEYDPSPYYFSLGDFVVVHPRAVACVIEVKTNLNKKSFYEALVNLRKSKEISLKAGVDIPHHTYIFGFKGVNLIPKNLHKWYFDAPVIDDHISYPHLIYVLKKGCLQLQAHKDKHLIHRFFIGEEDDEVKSRTLSIFLQSIRNTLEVYSGLKTSSYAIADLRDLYFSADYLRFGRGIVSPIKK